MNGCLRGRKGRLTCDRAFYVAMLHPLSRYMDAHTAGKPRASGPARGDRLYHQALAMQVRGLSFRLIPVLAVLGDSWHLKFILPLVFLASYFLTLHTYHVMM